MDPPARSRVEPQLAGERVVLRPPSRADLAALSRMFTDPEVMRYVAWGRPLTPAEVEEFVDRMIARFEVDGFGQFVLERRADRAVMGRAGLLPLDPETWTSGFFRDLGSKAEMEIGWTLARDYWGQGYAVEAATLVRDWAWGEMRLPRLVSIIQHGNDRSVRLAEKLGGRREREITTSYGRSASLFAYAPTRATEGLRT
jgi:RimJ/RimL family protein N-acetyltransferase